MSWMPVLSKTSDSAPQFTRRVICDLNWFVNKLSFYLNSQATRSEDKIVQDDLADKDARVIKCVL